MSDSLSSADRDARIAAAWTEQDCGRWLAACDEVEHDLSSPHFNVNRVATDVPWMIERMRKAIREILRLNAELRAALSREEEAKKDAERLDALEDWYVDSTGKRFLVGPDARGSSFVVDPCGASDVRVMIDAERAARSVSSSENGADEDAERDARIAACTRCDGQGWLESWGERSRCGCNPLSENG